MNILGFIKGIVTAITTAFLALSGAGTSVQPQQVASIASTTDTVIQQTVSEATTTSKNDVLQAYELGKSVGYLQGKTEAITNQPSKTMEENNTTAGAPTTSAPSTTAAPVGITGTPNPGPVPQPTTNTIIPMSTATAPTQAHIDFINPMPGKGLNRHYVASPTVEDENNYIDFAAVVYDENNNPVGDNTVTVTITGPDGVDTLDLKGTGDVATIYVNGDRRVVPAYSIHKDFKVAGDYVFLVTDGTVRNSVSLNVQPKQE